MLLLFVLFVLLLLVLFVLLSVQKLHQRFCSCHYIVYVYLLIVYCLFALYVIILCKSVYVLQSVRIAICDFGSLFILRIVNSADYLYVGLSNWWYYLCGMILSLMNIILLLKPTDYDCICYPTTLINKPEAKLPPNSLEVVIVCIPSWEFITVLMHITHSSRWTRFEKFPE